MVDVGRPIAFRAVVRVVEVQLRLVASETVVVLPPDRHVVVDAREDRLPVARLDERSRQPPFGEFASAVAPDTVRLLPGEARMEAHRVGRDRTDRHNVADLWVVFLPALVSKDRPRRPSLAGAAVGK